MEHNYYCKIEYNSRLITSQGRLFGGHLEVSQAEGFSVFSLDHLISVFSSSSFKIEGCFAFLVRAPKM